MKMKLFLFVGLIVGSISLSFLFSNTAHAAGESYRWIDANTIHGTGGVYDLNVRGDSSANDAVGTAVFKRDGNSGRYIGQDLHGRSGSSGGISGGAAPSCELQLTLVVTGNGNRGTPRQADNCNELSLGNSVTIADAGDHAPNNLPATAPTNGGGSDSEAAEDVSSCKIDGIGWILCPVMNFMGGITDQAYIAVQALLTVQPLTLNTSQNPTYDAWVIMRNFANIMFVIFFLIVIFSQLTSMGVSNYGIKKILPRLIVVAILVNLSYILCSIAVDISNILGGSFKNLLDGITSNYKASLSEGQADGVFNGENMFTNIVGAVLAGGAALGITLMLGLSVLLPIMITALLAIVTVVAVLTLRQALIIVLIVIAPLAFIAYMLPNTEDWFTKWRKLFMTLLLMYPIIAIIFGASAFAGAIIMNSADGNTKVLVQIMGAGVTIIPLFITPIVMRTAGGVLNRFGGFINNPNKGPIDALRKKADGYRDYRKAVNRGNRIDRAERFRNGEKFNGKIGGALYGRPDSRRRKVASSMFGRAYEQNQRDRKRKDRLASYESAAEETYNKTETGQEYATEAIQAKNRAATSQTNIAALATETTAKEEVLASQEAKDRQSIAETSNQAYAEGNRELGTRIDEALAKQNLEKAQKQGEVQVEEVKANRAVLTGETMISGEELRQSDEDTRVATGQLDAAQRVQNLAWQKKVYGDEDLAREIGGVDPSGATRAAATSIAGIHKFMGEAVAAEKETMDNMSADDLETILQDNKATVERRAAAASMITKVGGADKIMNTLEYLGTQSANPSGTKAEQDISDIQQQFVADMGSRKPTSLGNGDMSSLNRGTYNGNFDTKIVNRFEAGKLSGESLAQTSGEELVQMQKVYSANLDKLNVDQARALRDSINKFRHDPMNAARQPAADITSKMDALQAVMDRKIAAEAGKKPGTT